MHKSEDTNHVAHIYIYIRLDNTMHALCIVHAYPFLFGDANINKL